MPRRKRLDIANNYYHVLNRSNSRLELFFDQEDYEIFEEVLEQAWEMFNIEILAYCVMPNHFHLVVKTTQDGTLSEFMKWLTQTHTARWHVKNETLGSGSLYQGRFKSFIIQDSPHLFTVLRYVERNPFTAKMIKNPLDWKYSSLHRRYRGSHSEKKLLSLWPIEEPIDYLEIIKKAIGNKELKKIQNCENKSAPYGDENYIMSMVEKHELGYTQRGRGRPKST